MEIRKTKQRFHALEILAELKVAHGFEIATRAQLKVGTVYGILMAFEESGYVEGRWDDSQPDGRPRKKLYRLTEKGVALLAEYQDHFPAQASLGFVGSVNRELHTAIEEVWGGIWKVSVRREYDRQKAAAESAKQHKTQ
ncbi:MAG: PadR family transcriptional regulator [Pseudomonadaceae bacterium]|nr:PadR family transcriptional regulator [Pseudomonadaceae bacterium]